MRRTVNPASLLALAAAVGCATPEAPRSAATASSPRIAEAALEADNPLRPLPVPPLGVAAELADLPFRVTPEKVRLGRWLFFDARLSDDGKVSCATCHDPAHGFSETEPVSTGVHGKTGKRKAPPILNAAFAIYPVWFWDGRASSLSEQAKGPMANPLEMGMSHERIVAALKAIPGYRRYFAEAYGDDRVDLDRAAEAIASYEATRFSGNSAYDRFDAGDEQALTPPQRAGRDLFFGKAACKACHLGANLTDSRFHNLGVGWKEPSPGADPRTGFSDPGRAAVSGRSEDTGAFKTPTLRDCSRRAPYMHDGSVASLREVVDLYDRGGTRNPWLSSEMRPLGLTPAEREALLAFLLALDGEGFLDVAPRLFPR